MIAMETQHLQLSPTSFPTQARYNAPIPSPAIPISHIFMPSFYSIFFLLALLSVSVIVFHTFLYIYHYPFAVPSTFSYFYLPLFLSL